MYSSESPKNNTKVNAPWINNKYKDYISSLEISSIFHVINKHADEYTKQSHMIYETNS